MLDPVALTELGDLSARQIALLTIVDLVERCVQAKRSGFDEPLLFALSAAFKFMVDQQVEPLNETQFVVGAWLFELMLQGLGHAAHSQFA